MESFEESNASKDNLLEPPSINNFTIDDEDVKPTIKPRLSPLPRRRSSVSSDDGDLEPPPTVARKVSFADAFGFDLVSVKEFDTWEIPTVTQTFVMESVKIEEFYLTPDFILPPVGGIVEKLNAKKVTLEAVDFIPGTSSMKGIIRVLNVSFEKQVYVRMSLDSWQSYYDLLAEYVPDSCNGETDQFFFTIALVSPYQKEGARVEFCICYETTAGTFWDNNDGQNYVLTCQKKELIVEVDKPSEQVIDKNKKSCLKPSLSKENEDYDEFEGENPDATEKYIPRIICSHDDFSEDNNDEVTEDKSKAKNNEDESDVQLFLSQRLMNARITSIEEKYSTGFPENSISRADRQLDEEIPYLKNTYTGISDYNSDQPKECDHSEERLPITEVTSSKETEDFISLLSSNHHSGHYKALTRTQECLDESEKTELYLHGSELIEQEKISPVTLDEELHREPCQRSSTVEQSEYSVSDSCLKISEDPYAIQTDITQLTEIVEVWDDNANPNYGHSIATLPYFSTQDTKGIKDEQSEKSKSETIENDTLLPATVEHTEREHPMLFSQQEEFQNPLYKCKSSGSDVLETENAEQIQKICGFTSPGDAYLFRDGQEEATQNTNLSLSFCQNTKSIDNITEPEKQYITTDSDADINSASLDKQYNSIGQESRCVKGHKKIQVADDKNVVSETDDHIDRPIHAGNDSEKKSPVLEALPSIACAAAENVTQSTFHKGNAMLGTLPSEQTQGYKVIIAKITEEKGQSQTSAQDRQGSKGSAIDIGENVRAQQGSDEKSEEESSGKNMEVSESDEISEEESSGKNMEVSSDSIVSSDTKRVESVAEESTLKIHNISHLPTESIHYGDVAYIPRGKNELEHHEIRSDGLVGDRIVENDFPVIKSSNSFTALRQVLDVITEEDVVTEKETVDFTNVSQLVITDDIANIDNVRAKMEEGYVGPSIFISEHEDEADTKYLEAEQQNELQDTEYFQNDHTYPNQQTPSGTIATEPTNMGHVSSKVFCVIMFVVFAGLMYHFDFLVCFALYLFSLYWLYWEGGRNKNPVRKE
ncbi:protein phosphatase 1 regulatory subunit 3A [Anomaloglossus baeobatrachus]|uniref:protein phosphatase 1 regulatory subunit 3A n=1 Tax=Anomaloglossus baeobatrachus TaxID=238106 RepID=UPI003F4FA1CA